MELIKWPDELTGPAFCLPTLPPTWFDIPEVCSHLEDGFEDGLEEMNQVIEKRPIHSSVLVAVDRVFESICVMFPWMCKIKLHAQYDLLQNERNFAQVPDLSAKVLSAGVLFVCVRRQYSTDLATKDICSSCDLTSPTVRKAVGMFNALFPKIVQAFPMCLPTN